MHRQNHNWSNAMMKMATADFCDGSDNCPVRQFAAFQRESRFDARDSCRFKMPGWPRACFQMNSISAVIDE
jgi:hypothetical protein